MKLRHTLALTIATTVYSGVASAVGVSDYSELIHLIETGDEGRPLRTIDALLDLMIAKSPRKAADSSLVYASRSLQTASFQFPRVIYFGEGPLIT